MRVRMATAEEVPTIVNWTAEQYPEALDGFGKNTIVPVAENGSMRMAMPVQAVLFIWGIPQNPLNRIRDTVIALANLFDGVLALAKRTEVKNVYFVATTPEIEEEAVKWGFEKVEQPVYRRRV